LSDLPGTIWRMAHAAVRVRLDVTDVQAGMLLRAAGARRKAWNWAVAKIKANAEQWAAEATYGIARADRVRPLSYFALGKLWTAERPEAAPWADAHSTWTFRYALRDAAANLAAWGEHTLGNCPCVTQAGDRHPGGPSAESARHACGGWVSGKAHTAAPVLPGEAGTSRPRRGAASALDAPARGAYGQVRWATITPSP